MSSLFSRGILAVNFNLNRNILSHCKCGIYVSLSYRAAQESRFFELSGNIMTRQCESFVAEARIP